MFNKTNALLIGLLFPLTVHSASIQEIDYHDFKIWLDCQHRGASKFEYTTSTDKGIGMREPNFTFDNNVPKQCQQTSTKPYGGKYDRGHLVPENHLDYSIVAMRNANHVTNILPQTATMNRGAWLQTEEIIECYRDINTLTVIGGPIWGTDTSNDLFVQSHGVITPDAYWKVVINEDTHETIAWIVPNTFDATRAKLDSYLVSLEDIEHATGEEFSNFYDKKSKLTKSWVIPKSCNKS